MMVLPDSARAGDAASVAELLAGRDRTRAGRTAPPQGLTLVQVHYPDPD